MGGETVQPLEQLSSFAEKWWEGETRNDFAQVIVGNRGVQGFGNQCLHVVHMPPMFPTYEVNQYGIGNTAHIHHHEAPRAKKEKDEEDERPGFLLIVAMGTVMAGAVGIFAYTAKRTKDDNELDGELAIQQEELEAIQYDESHAHEKDQVKPRLTAEIALARKVMAGRKQYDKGLMVLSLTLLAFAGGLSYNKLINRQSQVAYAVWGTSAFAAPSMAVITFGFLGPSDRLMQQAQAKFKERHPSVG